MVDFDHHSPRMPDENSSVFADLRATYPVAYTQAHGGFWVISGYAQVLQQGLAEFGRLDFVIANAGVMPVFGPRANELASWQLCLDVLLTGVLNTVELTYRQIVEQGEGGSIVITSSMAGLRPMMRTESSHSYGLLGYSAAKAALVNLARNYASILARHRIRVNTVHPTSVNTPMIHNEMIAGTGSMPIRRT